VEISLKPGVWIDPQQFIQRIKDAGYKPREKEIRLTLTGTLSDLEGKLLLTLTDTKDKVSVHLTPPEKEKERQAFNQAQARIKGDDKKPVEVEGYWQKPAKKPEKGAPIVMVITRVNDADDVQNKAK
jgi:hypothetical protein